MYEHRTPAEIKAEIHYWETLNTVIYQAGQAITAICVVGAVILYALNQLLLIIFPVALVLLHRLPDIAYRRRRDKRIEELERRLAESEGD